MDCWMGHLCLPVTRAQLQLSYPRSVLTEPQVWIYSHAASLALRPSPLQHMLNPCPTNLGQSINGEPQLHCFSSGDEHWENNRTGMLKTLLSHSEWSVHFYHSYYLKLGKACIEHLSDIALPQHHNSADNLNVFSWQLFTECASSQSKKLKTVQ